MKILLLITVFLVYGCANNRDWPAITDLNIVTANKVAVVVQDKRPYVLNRSKEENFEGSARGQYTMPVDVVTKSSKPLAADMALEIIASLQKSGVNAVPVSVSPDASHAVILTEARLVAANKILYLVLNDWETDSYITTNLVYDLDLSVLDAEGNVQATSKTQGSESMGNDYSANDDAPPAFQRRLEFLFNADIKAMLAKTDR